MPKNNTPTRFTVDGIVFKRIKAPDGTCRRNVIHNGKITVCAFNADGPYSRNCQACDTTYCDSESAFVVDENILVKLLIKPFLKDVTEQVNKYYIKPS